MTLHAKMPILDSQRFQLALNCFNNWENVAFFPFWKVLNFANIHHLAQLRKSANLFDKRIQFKIVNFQKKKLEYFCPIKAYHCESGFALRKTINCVVSLSKKDGGGGNMGHRGSFQAWFNWPSFVQRKFEQRYNTL